MEVAPVALEPATPATPVQLENIIEEGDSEEEESESSEEVSEEGKVIQGSKDLYN